jgi:hypothetical protein
MHTPRDTNNSIANDLRLASPKWLERFLILLFVTLAGVVPVQMVD